MNKVCTHCRQAYERVAFPPNKQCRDGLASWCRTCTKEAGVRSVAKKPEFYATAHKRDKDHTARNKLWKLRNPEKVKAARALWESKNKEYSAAQRKKNREKINAYYRKKYAERADVRAYIRGLQAKRRAAARALALSPAYRAEIDGFYQFCQIFKGFEVDHNVPLNGRNVSGLHVPWNLQVLTRIENRRKGNRV